MLIIFGALKIEIAAVLDLMTVTDIVKADSIIIYEGKIKDETILAVKTGMGKANSEKALELIIKKYITGKKPSENNQLKKKRDIKFIITGFCGATDKNLKTGRLVIYDLIKTIGSKSKSNYTYKNYTHKGTLKLKNDRILNSQDKLKLTRVACGTVPEVIMLPCQKKIIEKQFGVQVIDLESCWIAGKIIEYNFPLYCIRVVSDTVEDKLPEYFGNFSKTEIAGKLLKSFLLSIVKPEELKMNIKAIKNIKKALDSLKPALEFLISYLVGKGSIHFFLIIFFAINITVII